MTDAESIIGSKYNSTIRDIQVKNKPTDEDAEIDLNQDLHRVQGNLKMAIEDLKTDRDIAFSPN